MRHKTEEEIIETFSQRRLERCDEKTNICRMAGMAESLCQL